MWMASISYSREERGPFNQWWRTTSTRILEGCRMEGQALWSSDPWWSKSRTTSRVRIRQALVGGPWLPSRGAEARRKLYAGTTHVITKILIAARPTNSIVGFFTWYLNYKSGVRKVTVWSYAWMQMRIHTRNHLGRCSPISMIWPLRRWWGRSLAPLLERHSSGDQGLLMESGWLQISQCAMPQLFQQAMALVTTNSLSLTLPQVISLGICPRRLSELCPNNWTPRSPEQRWNMQESLKKKS